jgi:hypothetical protein
MGSFRTSADVLGDHSGNTIVAPPQVSLFRLYLLRGLYLLIAFGLGSNIWPAIFTHTKPWALMHGVAMALLGALSAVAVLGVRYPLKMLPLLFFEMAWKVIWLLAVGLPLWRANAIDPRTAQTLFDVSLVVIVPFVIPWRYVFDNYVRKPGDRWW